MRWKALTFFGKLKGNDKENFGFKTVKCPSSVKELVPFENDMMETIKNLEFNPFMHTVVLEQQIKNSTFIIM